MVLTNTGSLMEDVICSRVVQRENTQHFKTSEKENSTYATFSPCSFLRRTTLQLHPSQKRERKDVSVRISTGNLLSALRSQRGECVGCSSKPCRSESAWLRAVLLWEVTEPRLEGD